MGMLGNSLSTAMVYAMIAAYVPSNSANIVDLSDETNPKSRQRLELTIQRQASLEELYDQAVQNRSLAGTFVKQFKRETLIPKYIECVEYSEESPIEGLEMMLLTVNYPEIKKDGITPLNSRIMIYGNAFSSNSPRIKKYGDFKSNFEALLVSGEIFSNGAEKIFSKSCIEGKFNLELFTALLNLESYGPEIKKHLRVENDGLVYSRSISADFAKTIMRFYASNYLRMAEILGSNNPQEGEKSIVRGYYIEQLGPLGIHLK